MNIFNTFLNLIFPPTCGFCNTLNSNFLCVNCLLKINAIKQSNIDNYELSDFYFKEHFYLFKYENNIRKFIINYKFNEHSYLYKTFSQIFKYDTVFKALALSIIPSIIFVFSGIMSRSFLLIVSSLLFVPSHILISYKNAKSIDASR